MQLVGGWFLKKRDCPKLVRKLRTAWNWREYSVYWYRLRRRLWRFGWKVIKNRSLEVNFLFHNCSKMLSNEVLHVTGGRPGLNSWKNLERPGHTCGRIWAVVPAAGSRGQVSCAASAGFLWQRHQTRFTISAPQITAGLMWLRRWSPPLRIQNIISGWGIREASSQLVFSLHKRQIKIQY